MRLLRHRLPRALPLGRSPGLLTPRCPLPFLCRSARSVSDAQLIASGKLTETREHSSVGHKISELRHYLRSTDIPEQTRHAALRDRLCSLVESAPQLDSDPELIPTIGQVLVHIHEREGLQAVPESCLVAVFLGAAAAVAHRDRMEYPPFMALVAQHFLERPQPAPVGVLVSIVEMGAALRFGDFKAALAFVLRYCAAVPEDFCDAVLDSLARRDALNLAAFQAVAELNVLAYDCALVDDRVVARFCLYIEHLYNDVNPDLHEYRDHERNIYRVQAVANVLVDCSGEGVSEGALLRLLLIKMSLNAVVASPDDARRIADILARVEKKTRRAATLEAALYRQDLFDESLVETLLLAAAEHRVQSPDLCAQVATLISRDDIRFLPRFRVRAQLVQAYTGQTYEQYRDAVHTVMETFLVAGDAAQILTDAAHALAALGPRPWAAVYQDLVLLGQQHAVTSPELYFYKHMLDGALACGDASLALLVFNDSLQNSAFRWADASDPGVHASLNRLVQAVVDAANDIHAVFPTFRRIRLHLTGALDAGALHSLARAMLAANCVGDVMEMMRRELPKPSKELPAKLVADAPWASAHRPLFDTLFDYVTNYRGDASAETNWALYGAVHDHFQVSPASYMPVLRFFCDVERLNAALVVFRTAKLLSELHGATNSHAPPLREMYAYLIRIFGERLYEEGVHELHQYMSMDVTLGADTELHNALLGAYANLQDTAKARDVFLAILANPRDAGGVNDDTARLMIKALTYGDIAYVTAFWNQLSTYGVFPTAAVFQQYVIAHVYHGLVAEATALVEAADDYNLAPTRELLLAMHNHCIEPHKQKEMAQWLCENHPGEWEQMRGEGLLRTAGYYEPDTPLLVEGLADVRGSEGQLAGGAGAV